MSKKSEAERLRVAKELAKKDGCEWGGLDDPGKHSYCHAADVAISPKPQTTLKVKAGHQHDVLTMENLDAMRKVLDETRGARGLSEEPETMTTEELLSMGIRVAPPEEKKAKEVPDVNTDTSGAGPDNKPPGSEDTSKPKKPRKSKAGKKARKNTK